MSRRSVSNGEKPPLPVPASAGVCRLGAGPRSFRRAAVAWLAIVAALVIGDARPASAQSVWELTPYRLQVFVATGRDPQFSPDFNARLISDLLARADAVVGAPWEITVVAAPADLGRRAAADVESVDLESLPKESLQYDKVTLLAVVPLATGYEVSARELDVHTQTWSPPARETAWQAGKLRDAAFRALSRSFAPLTRIASVDTENKLVTLRLRAAALPTRDKEFTAVKPGDLFLPIVRYNDREGNPSRISAVPWTFLTVDSVLDATLECSVQTGLRTPLTGRMRGRVERLALAVVPPRRPTRLVLKPRAGTDRVLSGYDVYEQSLHSAATQLLGRTDRQGSITLAPGEPLLRLLLVKHGGLLLAKLPVVPGLQTQLDAQVADDDQRLEAEGFLAGLQDDLVDLVTRRQLLLAQAKARLAAGALDEADGLLAKLRQLRTRDEFSRELAQEQQKTFADDKAVQQQIDAMFENTQKLLGQYLDPKPIEDLTDELAKARQQPADGT
jgi:hypothetical protein